MDKLKTMPRLDLIISDIMMDKMDGYEFCKNILKNIKYEEILFIFLSAKTPREDKIKGLSNGAQ